MPILGSGRPKRIPMWADYSDWGVSVMDKGQTTERHFHDAVEFVLIVSGRVQVKTEGVTRALGPGDSVLTRIGTEHSWKSLTKSVSIWAVSRLRGRKRPGHLHRKS